MNLAVVNSEADNSLDLVPHEFVQYAVVVALVLASYNPYYRTCLALEGIPRRIHIRCLGVVDVFHSTHAQYRLQPVLDRGEGLETVAYHIVADTCCLSCQCRSHRIVDVVPASERELVEVDLTAAVLVAHYDPVSVKVCTLLQLFLLGERKHLCLQDYVAQVSYGDGII